MGNFKMAFNFAAPHEWNLRQNYTNLPNDPGGPTKFGVTLKTWRDRMGSLGDINHDGIVDAQDIKLLTEDMIEPFYKKNYWDDYWQDIADDRLAAKLYDIGVNLGPRTAVEYLQTVLTGLVVDGRIGPKTILAANAADPEETIKGLCEMQRSHYEHWIAADPRRESMRSGLIARAEDKPTMEAA
jgi:lysozyme family protein